MALMDMDSGSSRTVIDSARSMFARELPVSRN